jgi:hypothetical protein
VALRREGKRLAHGPAGRTADATCTLHCAALHAVRHTLRGALCFRSSHSIGGSAGTRRRPRSSCTERPRVEVAAPRCRRSSTRMCCQMKVGSAHQHATCRLQVQFQRGRSAEWHVRVPTRVELIFRVGGSYAQRCTLCVGYRHNPQSHPAVWRRMRWERVLAHRRCAPLSRRSTADRPKPREQCALYGYAAPASSFRVVVCAAVAGVGDGVVDVDIHVTYRAPSGACSVCLVWPTALSWARATGLPCFFRSQRLLLQ